MSGLSLCAVCVCRLRFSRPCVRHPWTCPVCRHHPAAHVAPQEFLTFLKYLHMMTRSGLGDGRSRCGTRGGGGGVRDPGSHGGSRPWAPDLSSLAPPTIECVRAKVASPRALRQRLCGQSRLPWSASCLGAGRWSPPPRSLLSVLGAPPWCGRARSALGIHATLRAEWQKAPPPGARRTRWGRIPQPLKNGCATRRVKQPTTLQHDNDDEHDQLRR